MSNVNDGLEPGPGKAQAVQMSAKLKKICRRLERDQQESEELDELQEGLQLLASVVLKGSNPASSTSYG